MSLEKKLDPWLKRGRLENIGAFLVVYWRAKDADGPVEISQRALAEKLGWSRSKVRRFLREADKLGVIEPVGETAWTGTALYHVYGVKETDPEKKDTTARGKAPGYSREFEAAWSAWLPTRGGDKKQAWRYWQERVEAGWETAEIRDLCDHYIDRMRREGTDEKYIRHLATHLSTSGVDNLETERDAVERSEPASGESFAAYVQRNLV